MQGCGVFSLKMPTKSWYCAACCGWEWPSTMSQWHRSTDTSTSVMESGTWTFPSCCSDNLVWHSRWKPKKCSSMADFLNNIYHGHTVHTVSELHYMPARVVIYLEMHRTQKSDYFEWSWTIMHLENDNDHKTKNWTILIWSFILK